MTISRKDIKNLTKKDDVTFGDWLIILDEGDLSQAKRFQLCDLPTSLSAGIADADSDTRIQAEEFPDEDFLRFDTAGIERAVITNLGEFALADESDDIGGLDAKFTVYLEDEGVSTFISRFHSLEADAIVQGIRIGSRPSGTGTYLDLGVDAANSEAGFAIGAAFGSSDIIGEADLKSAALVFDANNDVRINNQLSIGADPGTSVPFTIKQASNSWAGAIWLIQSDDDNDIWSIFRSDYNFQFYRSTDGGSSFDQICWIDPTDSHVPMDLMDNVSFTGQHRMSCNSNLLDSEYIGLIASSKGIYKNITGGVKPTINDALPEVELSSNRYDKKAYGVISNVEDHDNRTVSAGRFVSYFKKEDDDRLIINSLGEGGIWVCNINGDLENGDYITTCEIPGYGMKQDDDLLHNYSVAKITCDCNFDLNSNIYDCIEFEFDGQVYKKAFVGCTYHCG